MGRTELSLFRYLIWPRSLGSPARLATRSALLRPDVLDRHLRSLIVHHLHSCPRTRISSVVLPVSIPSPLGIFRVGKYFRCVRDRYDAFAIKSNRRNWWSEEENGTILLHGTRR